MKLTILGKVIAVKETQKITPTFSKRELWVETPDPKYPQTLSIEFANDKCILLEDIAINEQVQIEASLRGNEYNGKLYTSISGWKIETVKKKTKVLPKEYEEFIPSDDNNNDLPF